MLEVSHLDILGNDFNELYPDNKCFRLVTLDIFHIERSGNDIKDLQPLNIHSIRQTFISKRVDNESTLSDLSLLKSELLLLDIEDISENNLL